MSKAADEAKAKAAAEANANARAEAKAAAEADANAEKEVPGKTLKLRQSQEAEELIAVRERTEDPKIQFAPEATLGSQSAVRAQFLDGPRQLEVVTAKEKKKRAEEEAALARKQAEEEASASRRLGIVHAVQFLDGSRTHESRIIDEGLIPLGKEAAALAAKKKREEEAFAAKRRAEEEAAAAKQRAEELAKKQAEEDEKAGVVRVKFLDGKRHDEARVLKGVIIPEGDRAHKDYCKKFIR
jgi:colicin import membrane protein